MFKLERTSLLISTSFADLLSLIRRKMYEGNKKPNLESEPNFANMPKTFFLEKSKKNEILVTFEIFFNL
jgi:hypothetical protein